MTQEQEGLKGERLLRNLLLLHNPDAQSSVWATPPRRQSFTLGNRPPLAPTLKGLHIARRL